MTTVRDMMHTNPARADELFAKLAETSDTAVSERGQLFSELKAELDLQAELEERHLFPALEKHEETRELVAGAKEDGRRTRVLLVELERAPRNGAAFAAKLAELHSVFQQNVRDDRREFLPAVVKALSGEEASAIVGKIEDGKARIEARDAKSGSGDREAEKARPARTGRKRTEAASKTANDQKDEAKTRVAGARMTDREGRGRADAGAEATQGDPARPSIVRRADADGATHDDTGGARRETTPSAAEAGNFGTPVVADMGMATPGVARVVSRAVGDGPRVTRAATPDERSCSTVPEPTPDASAIGGSMMAIVGEQTRHAMHAAAAIGRARTLPEVASAQSDFIGGSVERMGALGNCYVALVRAGMSSMTQAASRR